MRFVQFLQWYWDVNDWFNRTISVIGAWAVLCLIASIAVGKVAVLFALGGAVSVGIAWIIYGIGYWLRSMWKQFDDDRPTPEVAIVRKLKGIPTPSKEESRFYD